MKKFDDLGLKLAEYQAMIFEQSVEKQDCSSLVFIRRFKFSNLANRLDNANADVLLDVNYAFDELNDQYSNKKYGNEKMSKEVLFWIGYITRYFAYTREIKTKEVFELIDAKKLPESYYVYHTQSEEWTIERLLENANISSDYFDKDKRFKESLKKRYQ